MIAGLLILLRAACIQPIQALAQNREMTTAFEWEINPIWYNKNRRSEKGRRKAALFLCLSVQTQCFP
jgi:hypothetical protein